METSKISETYSLNRSTYINLRWIGILGQLITINSVKFIFNFDFDFISANIYSSRTNTLLFKPYTIENVNGTKVGFIGLTSVFSSDGITVTDPIAALKDVFNKIYITL